MTPARPHYMLFDVGVSGHHLQFIRQLVRYWVNHGLDGILDIVITPAFVELHTDFVNYVSSHETDGLRLHVLPLTPAPTSSYSLRKLIKHDRLVGQQIRRLVTECRPDHCILMYFDHNQLSLATGLRFPFAVSFSGLYFKPFPSDTRGITYWRKRLLLSAAIRNPHLDRLLCLDPDCVASMNRYSSRVNIEWLPDGIEPSENVIDLHQAYEIEPDRKVFLLFGHLSERKGIYQLLQAFAGLLPEERSRIALVLNGQVDKDDRERLRSAITEAAALESSKVVLDDRFILEDEVQSRVAGADLVLLPYQDHIGSSGVLIRAAAAGKPVIGPETGLVGTHIQHHRLGLTVDTKSAEAIRAAMRSFLGGLSKHCFDPDLAARFASAHTADAFARTIFRQALGQKLNVY